VKLKAREYFDFYRESYFGLQGLKTNNELFLFEAKQDENEVDFKEVDNDDTRVLVTLKYFR